MQVILLQNIEKVGDKHSVVRVKNGYGRNYLIPQGLALIANDTNMKKLDEIKSKAMAAEEAKLSEYQEMITKIESASIKIGVKSGTSGKIFGSVTNVQIANALREQFNLDIERHKIIMPEEVKEIGTYKAEVKLHEKVSGEVSFELIAE